MASTTTSLINHNFGGISRKDSSFSSELITCSDCQNVELYYTGLNSGIGIRTAKGNIAIKDLVPNNEEVIGMYEANMNGDVYNIIHTEDSITGFIRVYNITLGIFESIKDNENSRQIDKIEVTKTGNSSGCNFSLGWSDMFCITNGTDIRYIYIDLNNIQAGVQLQNMKSSDVSMKDTEGRDVKGLGCYVFDNRLWIFNDRVLWYSKLADCRNFSFQDVSAKTSAGYIEFVKPVTAIYPYLGSLAVFHKDSSCLITLDGTTGFAQSEESPGGCASYDALVFHGTDLYFYDDTKKGVYSFQQIVNGDKTLGQNVAYDIQEELMKVSDVSKIRTLSVVIQDRNEIWFLLPIETEYEVDGVQKEGSTILIFDYIRGAWVKRVCPKINCMAVIDSVLYSGGNNIYREYETQSFDGEFIKSYYRCTILNLGEDNTLKITKFPPRITANADHRCNFWVSYTKNYNTKKAPKTKNIKSKTQGGSYTYDSGNKYNDGILYTIKSGNLFVKLPSATFKALEIEFFTTKLKEEFSFKSIEFSKIKVKQV